MSDTIYILLPVHNRCEVTRRFIECLKVQTYRNFHLVLIDDGSRDGTSEMVSENISTLTVIRGTGNWWWSGSLQQGYRWLKKQNISTTDLVLIINDDTEFEKDFLDNAKQYMDVHHDTLLLAEGYDKRTGEITSTGVHVDWKKFTFQTVKTCELINCLPTRGLFIRMADLKTIGGFYPRWLPHYLSDYEFTIRAGRNGLHLCTDQAVRLVFDQETTGLHKVADKSFRETVIFYFTKKSSSNLMAMTNFIVLACPTRWKIINLVRVWSVALKKIGQSAVVTLLSRISGKYV